eukprot:510044-Pyramimonas_sp.AAC.1
MHVLELGILHYVMGFTLMNLILNDFSHAFGQPCLACGGLVGASRMPLGSLLVFNPSGVLGASWVFGASQEPPRRPFVGSLAPSHSPSWALLGILTGRLEWGHLGASNWGPLGRLGSVRERLSAVSGPFGPSWKLPGALLTRLEASQSQELAKGNPECLARHRSGPKSAPRGARVDFGKYKKGDNDAVEANMMDNLKQ